MSYLRWPVTSAPLLREPQISHCLCYFMMKNEKRVKLIREVSWLPLVTRRRVVGLQRNTPRPSSAVMMDVAGYSKTSVHVYHTTRRHFAEKNNVQQEKYMCSLREKISYKQHNKGTWHQRCVCVCVAQNECPTHCDSLCSMYRLWNTLTHCCSDVHYTAPDTTQSAFYSSRYYTKYIIQLQILH